METLFKTPAENAKGLVAVGEGKTKLSVVKMLILGFLAGAYIAFAAHLCTMVVHDASKYLGVGMAKFMGGSVFSVGLMLVILAGSELFTGNNLMVVGLLSGKYGVGDMLKNWVWVYIGNLIGSVFLAILIAKSGLWNVNGGLLGSKAIAIGYGKVHLSFIAAFARAIGCNWLVCIAVMFALASKSIVGKVWGIYFPIMAFVASGFEHCIANMYFIPAAIFAKSNVLAVKAFSAAKASADLASLNWGSFVIKNLIPVTLGNVVGGAVLVSCVYWFLYVKDSE
ncbi:formate/nitrite transporter family protein [Candidatus Auribacterota bacterium]